MYIFQTHLKQAKSSALLLEQINNAKKSALHFMMTYTFICVAKSKNTSGWMCVLYWALSAWEASAITHNCSGAVGVC